MPESDALSLLIALIYDAALDPNLWPRALESLAAFVGGSGANFFWHDLASESAGRFYSVGDDPAYRQLYFEKYAAMNPLFPATNFVETGAVVGMYDIVPRQEMTETRFYKEWIEPQKIVDSIGANLEKSSTSTSLVVVIRSEENGSVDTEARRRMALVVPHMMRAVSIGHMVDRHRRDNMALAETLGGISAGVFLVDARGMLVFVNDAGGNLLQDGKLLRDGQGVLMAVDPAADKALRDVFAVSGGGDAEIGIRGVAIQLSASSSRRWLAHVLPLTSGARREAGIALSATAAVFVRETGLDTPSALETLAKLYRLTGTEVRVLQGIVDIGGIPKVAKSLGISEGTAKTHLKSLFAKTGTNRQVELVKLIAGAASPF